MAKEVLDPTHYDALMKKRCMDVLGVDARTMGGLRGKTLMRYLYVQVNQKLARAFGECSLPLARRRIAQQKSVALGVKFRCYVEAVNYLGAGYAAKFTDEELELQSPDRRRWSPEDFAKAKILEGAVEDDGWKPGR